MWKILESYFLAFLQCLRIILMIEIFVWMVQKLPISQQMKLFFIYRSNRKALFSFSNFFRAKDRVHLENQVPSNRRIRQHVCLR